MVFILFFACFLLIFLYIAYFLILNALTTSRKSSTFIDSLTHFFLNSISDSPQSQNPDLSSNDLPNINSQQFIPVHSKTKFIFIIYYYLLYHFIAICFLYFVFPKFAFILQNPEFHHNFVFIVLLLPWIIVFLFQFTDPGDITPDNVDDYLKIYLGSNTDQKDIENISIECLLNQQIKLRKCAKLNIPAVPRSRFCIFSNKRIARYHHYCPWVMQPIGEKNLRLYFLFLCSNCLVCTYFLVISLIYLHWNLVNLSSIKWSKMSINEIISNAIMFAVRNDSIVCGIILFLLVVIITIIPVILREIYLISKNITLDEMCNEKYKKGINVYDKGIFQNWFEVLFPEALLD